MKLSATGFIKPCNLHFAGSNQCHSATNMISQQSHKNVFSNQNLSLKITQSLNLKSTKSSISKKCKELRENWAEFQGIKNWEGLLDPLDDRLRGEILRYGEFVEAAYRCFNFDASSLGYATCRYPIGSMLSDCGIGGTGYRVTKNLHANCGARLPDWTGDRVPNWVSTRSSWIGYVAVCEDEEEIARLGRRDVVVAYRGTATCMEWVENLRAMLTSLPPGMCDGPSPMVQSGFLSLYTSEHDERSSLQSSIRSEIDRILREYADEPLSITVTGHSLGAALATLTAHDINSTFASAPLVTVVSFGGPRVGNREFRSQLERNGTRVLRIVNADDPVTKVPGFVFGEEGSRGSELGFGNWLQKRVEDTQWAYAEVGEELRLSSKDCPHLSNGSVATCHDLKTYLQLVDSFVSSNCPLKATAKRVLGGAQDEKQQLQQQQILYG